MSTQTEMNNLDLEKQYCEFEAEKDEFHNNAAESRDRPWLKNKSSIQIMRGEVLPGRDIKPRALKYYARRAYIYPETHEEIYTWGVDSLKSKTIPPPPNGKPNFSYFLQEYLKHLKNNQR